MLVLQCPNLSSFLWNAEFYFQKVAIKKIVLVFGWDMMLKSEKYIREKKENKFQILRYARNTLILFIGR